VEHHWQMNCLDPIATSHASKKNTGEKTPWFPHETVADGRSKSNQALNQPKATKPNKKV